MNGAKGATATVSSEWGAGAILEDHGATSHAMLKLPVTYRGEEFEYPLTVVPQGYTTRYIVDVDGVEVVYERDDSAELRAMIRDEKQLTGKLPERELLAAIGAVLEQVLS